MEIAETSPFTKEITRILTDDEYKELQNFLVANPKGGDVIKSKTEDLTPKQIEMLRKTFMED